VLVCLLDSFINLFASKSQPECFIRSWDLSIVLEAVFA